MTNKIFFLISLLFFACKDKVEKTKPTVESVSESIYASGIIKSKNQYQAFSTVSGIINEILVSAGDPVKKGTPLLTISNEAQRINKDNAELSARFSDYNANQGKLNEAKLLIDLAMNKMKNDSALFVKQKVLWQQQVGTANELDQRELAYQNSKTTYYSSLVKYNDLKRQLEFTSSQTKKNLQLSNKIEGDYTLKSEIDGMVYSFNKSKGDLVGPQTPLAVIGAAKDFILEMQVDEYDILKIKKGLSVIVALDSYKGKVFEAKVTHIDPFMNERSKTFKVEAEFVVSPDILYPNLTFEANIVLQSKNNALLVPRNYLYHDSLIIKVGGDTVLVQTGLKDYKKIEILTGIGAGDELIKPKE